MDDSDEQGSISRRKLMRVAAGATAAAATASAASGTAAAKEHTVNMTDGLKFDPADLTIAPGDSVVFKNTGSLGHSVTAYEDNIPDGATYFASGGFESESAARSGYPSQGNVAGGESFSHTFNTKGTFEYFCIPHEAAGMKGSITVEEQTAATDTGPSLPETAKTVVMATLAAMGSTLALAYFFLKYGGGREPQPE